MVYFQGLLLLVSGRVTLKSGWLEDDPFPFGPGDFLRAVYIMSNFGGGGISSSSRNPPVILVDGSEIPNNYRHPEGTTT